MQHTSNWDPRQVGNKFYLKPFFFFPFCWENNIFAMYFSKDIHTGCRVTLRLYSSGRPMCTISHMYIHQARLSLDQARHPHHTCHEVVKQGLSVECQDQSWRRCSWSPELEGMWIIYGMWERTIVKNKVVGLSIGWTSNVKLRGSCLIDWSCLDHSTWKVLVQYFCDWFMEMYISLKLILVISIFSSCS